MYKQCVNLITQTPVNIINRLSDNACIPFDPNNQDFVQFKKDIANGATLQDPTGTPITGSALTTFIQGLK
jgi:hypothetical protein